MNKLISTVAYLIFLLPCVFYSGYILSCLWEWFVVPTFPDVVALSVAQATGLYVIYRFIAVNSVHVINYQKLKRLNPEQNDDFVSVDALLTIALQHTIIWAIAYVVRFWVI